MAILNGYLTLTRFKDEYDPETSMGSAKDEEIERAVEASSRLIDNYCGRVFYDTGSATARTYVADDPYELDVDDFHTTTGLAVATDTTGDGTFDTTWSASGSPADFQVEPLNPINGYPYNRIVAIDDKTFPVTSRHPRVQVTARWGWAAVPKAVEQACLIQATRLVEASSHVAGGLSDFDVEGGGAFPLQSRFLERSAQLLVDPLRRLTVRVV